MNTIKDYYVEIQNLYNEAIKILTTLNQSLYSQASTIPLTIIDDNSTETVYQVPSFLYLENKIENLSNNFSELFKLPASGEAWFVNDLTTNMYKLRMDTAGTAPFLPTFNTAVNAFSKENNIFKDMVFPTLYLKMSIDNLEEDIEKVGMKKVIFYSSSVYNQVKNTVGGDTSLSNVNAVLYNYTQGKDWDVYDAVINLPQKSDVYKSSFSITDYDALNDVTLTENGVNFNLLTLALDTVSYTSEDDASISKSLVIGDYLVPSEGFGIYQVYNIDDTIVQLKEISGHVSFATTEISGITLQLYSKNYSKYHYVEIPLEENPYILVFLSSIRNNVRSSYSSGIFYDLTTIKMKDASGNDITKPGTTEVYNYIEYYNEVAKNAGDILKGITDIIYPQVSNLTLNNLETIQSSDTYKLTVSPSKIKVTAINNHLSDDTALDEIKTLNTQKSQLESDLSNVKTLIDSINVQLSTIDFSQNKTVTRASLTKQLQSYYAERVDLETQIISVINNINIKANSSVVPTDKIKYRLRGSIDFSDTESVLQGVDSKINIVGLDVQYKYKSISKDTTSTTTIAKFLFTDWNSYPTIQRPRYINANTNKNTYSVDFVDTSESENVIKWNQVDIPIQQGEDVVVRVRAIYNIGQPFVNIYSPWSDETTFEFPSNLTVNSDIVDILATNKDDAISAKFSKKLIEDGYEDHVNNKVTDNAVTYFHQPENIASGFYTAEQKIISLKDKMYDMSTSLDNVNSMIGDIKSQSYTVTLSDSTSTINLKEGTLSTFEVQPYLNNSVQAAANRYVENTLQLTIKNTGTSTLYFYSIFPGSHEIILPRVNTDYFMQRGGYYDIFPIYVNGGFENQKMGQWIYFRNVNPFTAEYDDFYMTQAMQEESAKTQMAVAGGDFSAVSTVHNLIFSKKQQAFRYKSHEYFQQEYVWWNEIEVANDEIVVSKTTSQNDATTEINKYSQYQNFWVPQSFFGKYNGKKFIDIAGSKDFTTYYNTDIKWDLGLGNDANSTIASSLTGAFLFPNIVSENLLWTTTGQETSYKSVKPGDSISIPLTFQFYLNEQDNTVTKRLYFDLRPTIFDKVANYMVEITANYSDQKSAQITSTNYSSSVSSGTSAQ